VYLWDANILRHFGNNHQTINQHLQRVPWTDIALPSVVVAEALRGRCEYALKARPDQAAAAHQELLKLMELLQTFVIVSFDESSATVFAQMLKQHQSRKRYADLMIAALAKAGQHIVVTRNTKDFADLLPKAQLENWIDDAPVH
jgi:predicted nucleic acid-binding protein